MGHIKAGDQVPFYSFAEFTRDQLRSYANASGDHNPIHLDEQVAKRFGLPGVIVHGMLGASLIAERALLYVETTTHQNWKMAKFNSRFKAMCFPGDTIAVGGEVKSVTPTELVLDLSAKNQKGELITTATVRFGLVQ